MNVLDWLLIVLVLAYALSGYWQGFVTGAFATTGLVLGGLLGVWLAPIVLGDANPSLFVSLGALFIVILAASLGQAVLQFSGARVRDRITWQPVRALDAVGGAVLSAVAVLLVRGRSASRWPAPGSAASRRWSATPPCWPGSTTVSPTPPTGCSTPSTTSSVRRSSRATSSRSPPNASWRWARGPAAAHRS